MERGSAFGEGVVPWRTIWCLGKLVEALGNEIVPFGNKMVICKTIFCFGTRAGASRKGCVLDVSSWIFGER